MKDQKWVHVNEEKPDTPAKYQSNDDGIEFDWRSVRYKLDQ
jgi:hypothetical protein